MNVEHIEILVEEPSMEAALSILLPRILGSLSFRIYVSNGKQNLLRNLPDRLRGYSRSLPADHLLIVVVDRDNQDCRELKKHLEKISLESGLQTRTTADDGFYRMVNRIVCEELEAWYFGDWDAVRQAFPNVPQGVPRQKGYRSPDAIKGGTWEAFERILLCAGYYRNGLSKIGVARQIAPHLEPTRNRSPSFQCLLKVLTKIAPDQTSDRQAKEF